MKMTQSGLMLHRHVDVGQAPFATIHDAEIEKLFKPLRNATGIVLAVSGGPDSLALLALMARWRNLNSLSTLPPIYVASVDHALRANAAVEANAVKVLASGLGFPVRVLVWQGEKPAGSIQEMARTARYSLLCEAAQEWGASHIVTAHHRNDQAETVLMRLASGSGVGGLAAMRPFVALGLSAMDGRAPIALARPLLGMTKAQLETVILEAGFEAVDDPANRNPRFARARLRGLEAERNALGLSADRLATLAARCARADSALSAVAQQRFSELSEPGPTALRLKPALWFETEEIILRCIALAVTRLSECFGRAGDTQLSLERLERLIEAFQTSRLEGQALHRTLHGMIVRLDAAGGVTVSREPERRRGRKIVA